MSERIAIGLDIENLLHPFFWEVGAQDVGLQALVDMIRAYEQLGPVVSRVGFCNRRLQARSAFELAKAGVRVFGHDDRSRDAADRLLIAYFETALPRSATRVVIGSGDHIFATQAMALKASGRRVDVIAPEGGLALELHWVADSSMALSAHSEQETFPAPLAAA